MFQRSMRNASAKFSPAHRSDHKFWKINFIIGMCRCLKIAISGSGNVKHCRYSDIKEHLIQWLRLWLLRANSESGVGTEFWFIACCRVRSLPDRYNSGPVHPALPVHWYNFIHVGYRSENNLSQIRIDSSRSLLLHAHRCWHSMEPLHGQQRRIGGYPQLQRSLPRESRICLAKMLMMLLTRWEMRRDERVLLMIVVGNMIITSVLIPSFFWIRRE